jgi:hypothetical protein
VKKRRKNSFIGESKASGQRHAICGLMPPDVLIVQRQQQLGAPHEPLAQPRVVLLPDMTMDSAEDARRHSIQLF